MSPVPPSVGQRLATFLDTARRRFAACPPKVIHDALNPAQSRLLDQSLAQHLHRNVLPQSSIDGLPKGSPLPLGHHLIHFPTPPLNLMFDGTDPDHCPGGPYLRRMWAGGSIEFAPSSSRDGELVRETLRLGQEAVCVETVESDRTEIKLGKRQQEGEGGEKARGLEGRVVGDEKVFVYVRRDYDPANDNGSSEQETAGGGRETVDGSKQGSEREHVPLIREIRTLVFMSHADKTVTADGPRKTQENKPEEQEQEKEKEKKPLKMPGPPADASFTLIPDDRLLFHFSALSFNAHGIHVDRAYAREKEGYPDLLVHGPLLLCLMLKGIEASIRDAGAAVTELARLDYRNLRPLFVDQPLTVRVRLNEGRRPATGSDHLVWDVWVEGPDGGLAVKGTARLRRHLGVPQRG